MDVTVLYGVGRKEPSDQVTSEQIVERKSVVDMDGGSKKRNQCGDPLKEEQESRVM